jgi:O-antigen/teichoic acid export membrane protein
LPSVAHSEAQSWGAVLPGRAPSRALGGSAWAFIDHGLISATNFFTVIALARGLSPTAFGLFVIAYTALLLAATFQSALVTQPHNVLATTRTGDTYLRHTTSTAVTQLALALLFCGLSAVAATAAWLAGSSLTAVLLALIPALMGWQLQEFARRVLYTEERYRAAFVNDLVSYGGQIAGIAALWSTGELSASRALLVVAATSALAACFGFWQLRRSLARKFDRGFVRENWAFGKWIGGALLAAAVSAHAYFYVAAALLGAAASGALKAAQTLLGPLNVVLLFLNTVLPIRFARTLAEGGEEGVRSQLKSVNLLVAPFLFAYCAIAALFAAPLMRFVYGDHYGKYGTVVVLFAAYYVISYVAYLFSAAITAKRRTRDIFVGNVYGAATTLAFGWIFIETLGVEGAVVGMTVAVALVAATFWRAYRKSMREDVE